MTSPPTLTPDSRELLVAATHGANEKAADEFVAFNVAKIVGICEVFAVCSASNTRQVGAIVNEIVDQVAASVARKPFALEGMEEKRWVLIDYGDVVIHVFEEHERSLYRLERLYSDAPRIELSAA